MKGYLKQNVVRDVSYTKASNIEWMPQLGLPTFCFAIPGHL